MKTVTAAELLILDEKRFDQEYNKWLEYTADYDWWDYIYEDFKAQCHAMHITVDNITFSGFWSQGDGAAFAGRVDLTALMERKGLDVEFPALYIGVKNDGSYSRLAFNGNNMRCGAYENYANQTAPDGVFSGLDQEAWEELIEEQDTEARLEDHALEEGEALAADLYNRLEEEYECLTSKEAFIESCECNEVTFEIETEEEEA
jgi:hypothetical protein